VTEVKDKETNPDYKYDIENNENRNIINTNPTFIVVTRTIQPEELVDPEEGKCLFHSHMWVKGTPFHFIVGSSR
jgi:hypothetical protein